MTDSTETSPASVGEPARASSPLVAVTGATGAVGGIVALHLSERGVPLRLVVRDAARAPRLDGAEAEVAVATYGDRAASVEALRGVDTLFMVSAAEAPDRVDQHRSFVDAAVEAGVRHVVYTSFAGASADSVFTLGRDHFATEQHIRESGLAFTFLRDNFYLDFIPLFADERGIIRGPAGDGRVAAVARADVAAVAAVVLLRVGGVHPDRGGRSSHRPRRAVVHVRGRDGRRGLRVPPRLRARALPGGRLGQHLHVDGLGRGGAGDVVGARPDRTRPADARGALRRRRARLTRPDRPPGRPPVRLRARAATRARR
jgi:uncharacterized protein YbjT (DUF2867 family)